MNNDDKELVNIVNNLSVVDYEIILIEIRKEQLKNIAASNKLILSYFQSDHGFKPKRCMVHYLDLPGPAKDFYIVIGYKNIGKFEAPYPNHGKKDIEERLKKLESAEPLSPPEKGGLEFFAVDRGSIYYDIQIADYNYNPIVRNKQKIAYKKQSISYERFICHIKRKMCSCSIETFYSFLSRPTKFFREVITGVASWQYTRYKKSDKDNILGQEYKRVKLVENAAKYIALYNEE